MQHRLFVIACLAISAMLSGCGAAPTTPAGNLNDPNMSLVLGYIDMEDAPTAAGSATIVQTDGLSDAGAQTPARSWNTPVSGGLFTVALPAGNYALSNISSSRDSEGGSQYKFPAQNSDTSVSITKPGIYFLGAFKYRKVKSLYFEEKNFIIDKVAKPREADLLQRVLDNRDIGNSALGEKIRARLAQLK